MPLPDLAVYLNGEYVAHAVDAGQGYIGLQYDERVVADLAGVPLLSIRLPVRAEAYPGVQTRAYFEGLLPEGDARTGIANELRVPEWDVFALLRAIGGDCAGAVALFPVDEPFPEEEAPRWLEEDELAQILRELPVRPLAVDPEHGIRISLAGAQDKLVVIVAPDGRVALPRGTSPSTHIVKPPSGRQLLDGELAYPDLVRNEAFCLRVAAAAGIPAAHGSLRVFGRIEVLMVERFDRLQDTDRLRRLHQEDVCQALGLLPHQKYEEPDGPSIAAVADLVRTHSADVARDLPALIDRIALSVAVGDDDFHGKNIALLHTAGGIRLAPAYDLVSTAVYPYLTPKLAMRIGGELYGRDLRAESWANALVDAGLTTAAARRRLGETGRRILAAVDRSLSEAESEGWAVPLHAEIANLARERAAAIADLTSL